MAQSGVIRARSLNDLLQFARGLGKLPTPKGENVVIITGAGGSGVSLSDACVDNGLKLMKMPKDLDTGFRQFIPPFGAAGRRARRQIPLGARSGTALNRRLGR